MGSHCLLPGVEAPLCPCLRPTSPSLRVVLSHHAQPDGTKPWSLGHRDLKSLRKGLEVGGGALGEVSFLQLPLKSALQRDQGGHKIDQLGLERGGCGGTGQGRGL